MYEKEIRELHNNYNNLLGYSEEDIKVHIVRKFLILLGYKEEWFKYENPTFAEKRRIDISVYLNGDKKNLFFVEVKKADNRLDISACSQLANYLNSENIEWGMLTNGLTYILFNNNVKAPAHEKEILRFYLRKPDLKDKNYQFKRNNNNLKYFSYNYLFQKKVTEYFRYIKEYKLTFNNLFSFRQYESVLYNYFDYLSEQELYFDIVNIRPNTFKNYLLYCIEKDNNRCIKRKETITTKYAYIRGFYSKTLEKTEKQNPFKDIRADDLLKDVSLKKHKKETVTELLSKDEINLLLNSYNSSRNSLRNKIIFLLFLYCGLDVSEIQKLKINDINFHKNEINIENRIVPIHPKLIHMIKNYLDERKSKKIKCNYLFYRRSDKKYTFFRKTNFNDIISKQFNTIKQIPSERKELLTPYFIKWSLVKQLYKNGVSIDEIVKFTGLSLTTINSYISIDEINKKANFKNIMKKHPYDDIFNSL